MKIFDVHTHVFPDAIAARAVAHLRERSGFIPAYADGTARSLAEHARAAGYTGCLNCPVVTRPSQIPGVNDHVARLSRWPHLSLGGIHPEVPDIPGELRRIKGLGLPGIKLHPEYQGFSPLEPRLEILWETCQELGLPVLVHAGQDIGFPGCRHSRPRDFAELARRHPRLVLICAHLGGWRDWDEVLECLAGSPVYLDTSFSRPWMDDPGLFERIIRKHGPDRVLFGSDSPWSSLAASVQEILDLHLPPDQQERILWGNADRIFGLEARLAAAAGAGERP